MSNNIQLHKNDLPDDLKLNNDILAVDGEFMNSPSTANISLFNFKSSGRSFLCN